MAAAHMLGQLAGDYRIERLLGSGHLGSVYEAVRQAGAASSLAGLAGDRAAIKVLSPAISRSERVQGRFPYEARAVGLVRHPGLAEILEFGLLPDGCAYLVMELLAGETLGAFLRAGRGQGDGIGRCRRIAQALAAAHAEGVTHLNLKPDNVMLVREPEGEERIKVLDLGLLRMATGGECGALQLAIGTPAYMAPEQLAGTGGPEAAADVYALGAILYECVAGRPPFAGSTPAEVLLAQTQGLAPLLDEDPLISEELSALVARMLGPCGGRPDMAEVAGALQRLDERRTTTALPAIAGPGPGATGPRRRPGRATFAWAQLVVQQRQEARARERAEERKPVAGAPARRIIWLAMGLALLVALGGGITYLLRQPGESAASVRKDPPPPPPKAVSVRSPEPVPPPAVAPGRAADEPGDEPPVVKKKKKKRKANR
jgi:serine/threonine-protein kinase